MTRMEKQLRVADLRTTKTLTRFDPDNIKEWHKVIGFSYNFQAQTIIIIFSLFLCRYFWLSTPNNLRTFSFKERYDTYQTKQEKSKSMAKIV